MPADRPRARRSIIFSLIAAATGWALLAVGLGRPAPAEEFTADPAVLLRLRPLAEKFDLDGSHSLDPRERKLLNAFLAGQEGAWVARTVEAAIGQADADHDGTLSLAEWLGLQKWAEGAPRQQLEPRHEKLKMAGDALLATDVYLPRGAGPWPVVLMRTPYNKNGLRATAKGLTDSGCALVAQDMRGRFASGGENLPFIGCGWAEPADGPATVAWIRGQKWCDGRVATYGASALGITQLLLAAAAPEGLTAQYIEVAAGDFYRHIAYPGGALRQSLVEGWLTNTKFSPQALELMRAHPLNDDYWQKLDADARCEQVGAPAVLRGGWFDVFALGTIRSFQARQQRAGAAARGAQRLVMGPWAHAMDAVPGVGELAFPNYQTPPAYRPEAWFAWRLQGVKNAATAAPAVAYYVMGDACDPTSPGNEWRFAAEWPGAVETVGYYPTAAGELVLAPPTENQTLEKIFDPADPCPTIGGGNLCLPAGPRDQRPVESRPDLLVFSTPVLDRPLEIRGEARAEIYLSSSAVDTDLSVRLCDVYPDGASYLMAEGYRRGRLLSSNEKAELLKPGEVYRFEVELSPLSLILNRGHRLRIDVTFSNHPRFDVNPGTGEPGRPGGPSVKQTNRIYLDPTRASRVLLPVVPGQ